jgi:phenylalanyl-tRNA synthetase alpha chain
MSIQHLTGEAYRRALSLPDLTDAACGPHALQLVVAAAIAALRDAWRCPVLVHRRPPEVTVAENYDRLHYPPDGAARDARYTRYVTDGTLLRTQTSALLPALLATVARAPYDDVLLACPGLVYRRDAIDRLHAGEPHQLDLWRLSAAPLDERGLAEMIATVVAGLLPGAAWRTSPASHPYTVAGRQIDVRAGADWIEIGECGLALPALLAEAGLPARHTGLAMGLGLDRILMIRKGIDDIRLLRSSDPRVASQMCDLAPYRPVSSQPPIRRDLSLAVDQATTAEDLGDRVRAALGDQAAAVESVELLSETPWADLPAAARARLGLTADQKNALVRITLRHPTRTLTHAEANQLRDLIWDALRKSESPTSRSRGGAL